MDLPVMLTVRGTRTPRSVEEARALHNTTAGSPQGIEGARSLSDISHCVFLPAAGAGKLTGAKPEEMLFIDYWTDPAGLQRFFSNPQVVEQGAKLFSDKDAAVWMPARGAFAFRVPPTSGKRPAFVGLLRAPVKSPEAAIEAFAAVQGKGLQANRRRGQLSHELYVKLGAPDEPVEVIGVDTWSSLEGLVEAYADPREMAPLMAAFAGAPAASVWEQATGFNEW